MEAKKVIETILNAGVSVEELSAESGISASSLRGVLKGHGVISKYGIEKLKKYCEEKNISLELD